MEIRIPNLADVAKQMGDITSFAHVLEGLKAFPARRPVVIAYTLVYVYKARISGNRWRLTLFNASEPRCGIIHRTHGKTGVFIWDDNRSRFFHESIADGLYPLTDILRRHFQLGDKIKYSETFFMTEGYNAIVIGPSIVQNAIEAWEQENPGRVLFKNTQEVSGSNPPRPTTSRPSNNEQERH
jgi:hypothetical protein